MRDIFNKANWPSMWADAERLSKRQRSEETAREKFEQQGWYQELFDEEGEYEDPNILLSFNGNYLYFIDPYENTISACDLNQHGVGELLLGTGEDGRLWLETIHVREEYQRQGIGTELVRLAVTHLEEFFIAGVQECDDYAFSLSDGGANLINACLRLGYINEDLILFPPDIPLNDDVGDPGLIIGFGRIGDIYTARTRAQDEYDLDDHDERLMP